MQRIIGPSDGSQLGFLKGDQATASLEALDEKDPERRKVYIRTVIAMMVKVTFESAKGVAEERALIDSGASENFLDQETWQKLGIGSVNLEKPI